MVAVTDGMQTMDTILTEIMCAVTVCMNILRDARLGGKMNDLNVSVNSHIGSIDCNFQELKEALAVQMTAYTSLEITEDSQKEAKKDLATLRKIRKAVEDKRIAVKKEYMKPYTEFEAQEKDLLSVIDEPINMIDNKLKQFESARIAEKEKHLHELYEQNIGEYGDYLPYMAVAREKWINTTYADKDVLYDISESITRVRSDINVIKALNSEIEEECLKAYKESGNDLAAAITKNSDFIKAKQLVENKKPVPMDDVLTIRIEGKDNIDKVKDFLSFAEIEYKEV